MENQNRALGGRWNSARLREIVGQLTGKRVLVVGDVGVDRYVTGKVERISPEAPVPIVNVEREYLKLGLAANVADNVHALRGECDLIGVVGRDRGAQDLAQLLGKSKISTQGLVREAGKRTTLKERVLGENQQLLRIDYETAGPIRSNVSILAKVRQLIPACDVVILQDYAKGLMSAELIREVCALARKHKKWVAVDPNGKTPPDWYRFGVRTLFKPNLKEAEQLSGVRIRDDQSLGEAGQLLLKKTRAEVVVITRGKEGMAIFMAGQKRVRKVPTFSREVYDVSGAGDTVIAVLAMGLAAGASVEESAIVANLAAGVEVSKRGTATVTQAEILDSLRFFIPE